MDQIFCNSPECPNPARTGGLCPKHYEQGRKGSTSQTRDDNPYPKCAVSHCEILATGRKEGSLCNPHYQKKYRGEDPEEYILPPDHPARFAATCAEPGCLRDAVTKGVCGYHRKRAQMGRTTVAHLVKVRPRCSFEGCESGTETAGLCHSHYEQLRTRGELKPLRDYGKYVDGKLRCPIPRCRKGQETRGLCAAHSSLVKKYRVTRDELIEIWTDPKCGNLGCTNTTRLHMDHDHTTGRFRALLCGGCNTSLGHLKEDRERIMGLVAYLDLFTDKEVLIN